MLKVQVVQINLLECQYRLISGCAKLNLKRISGAWIINFKGLLLHLCLEKAYQERRG